MAATVSWLALLPGYDGLRVPARFAMLAALCLSIAAGLAVARLQVIWRRGFAALAAIVLAGLVLDGVMQSVPLGTPPPRAIIPGPPDAAVLDSPLTTRASTSRRCIGQWSTAGRC